MIERENVQVIIYTLNPEPLFLALKRIREKGGYWQPVCGGIEPVEEPLTAIKRETLEETGITTFVQIIDLDYFFDFVETKNNKTMKMRDHCFAIEIESKQDIILSDEHEHYEWIPFNEIENFFTWEYNLIAIRKLLELISK